MYGLFVPLNSSVQVGSGACGGLSSGRGPGTVRAALLQGPHRDQGVSRGSEWASGALQVAY